LQRSRRDFIVAGVFGGVLGLVLYLLLWLIIPKAHD